MYVAGEEIPLTEDDAKALGKSVELIAEQPKLKAKEKPTHAPSNFFGQNGNG